MNETTTICKAAFITPTGWLASLELDELVTSAGTRYEVWVRWPASLEEPRRFDLGHNGLGIWEGAMRWAARSQWVLDPTAGEEQAA